MKKLIGWSIVTAFVIGLLTWLASTIFSFSYGEWSFFIGLGLTVVIFFFSSSGGTLSKIATQKASESVWKIQKDNELKTRLGPLFFGSLFYTVVSFLAMIILYF